jgi:hypothetical protein
VKEWHVVDPKMIFAKNQELVLLPWKPTPVPAKSAGACAIQNIPPKISKYIMHIANDDMDAILRFL